MKLVKIEFCFLSCQGNLIVPNDFDIFELNYLKCVFVCVFPLPSQEIIQQLIDNSSTFKDKTEYAQDKYIKKKKKK